MADMIGESANLADLRRQAGELASAVEALGALFEEGSAPLKRKDQAARLTGLRSTILREVQQARQDGESARFAHSRVSVPFATLRLCAGLIAARSQDPTVRRISHAVASTLQYTPTFGRVAVRIGTKGLPEAVAVVCVSRLARDAKVDEITAIERLRQHGYELLSDSAFTALIDQVIEKILKGELELPVPLQKLPCITIPSSRLIPVRKRE